MPARDRIAIVGLGHVGATAAYAIMLRALFHEIVLIDSDTALARAEAADLSDANALARPARIWAGEYLDAASARIAVITAGAATHGAASRLSVAKDSAEIVAACAANLRNAGFSGVIVVSANPVDLMTMIAFRHAGLPATRVMGTGTLLDSSRLRQSVAASIAVAPTSIDALVVGEHGDSEVAVMSGVRVGGIPLSRSVAAGEAARIAAEVRDAGYRIIEGKGYTSYGVATAIVRICEAIARDESVVLPVSTLLSGECGIDGVYLSLPCVIGANGVERVLVPDLDETERAALEASADVLRLAMTKLDTA